MKNIEERLRNSGSRAPKREVSADFSSRIVTKLIEQPKSEISTRARWFSLSRPAVVMTTLFLVIFALAGSVTFAATNGFGFLNALFESSTTRPDGSRLVAIKGNNCEYNYYNERTDMVEKGDVTKLFYVKPESNITDKDLTRLLQGRCEAAKDQNQSVALYKKLLKRNPKISADAFYWGFTNAGVVSLGAKSVTLQVNEQSENDDGPFATGSVKRTFSVSKAVLVVDENDQPISLDQIHTREIVYYAASNSSAEYGKAGNGGTLLYVKKITDNVLQSEKFEALYGKEFNQVSTCDNNSDAYCDSFSGEYIADKK